MIVLSEVVFYVVLLVVLDVVLLVEFEVVLLVEFEVVLLRVYPPYPFGTTCLSFEISLSYEML